MFGKLLHVLLHPAFFSQEQWFLEIENADATLPNLEVFHAVGELSGFAGFCADLCGEQVRACFHNHALLNFVVLIVVILLIPQSQTTFQSQDCHSTFCLIWLISWHFLCLRTVFWVSWGSWRPFWRAWSPLWALKEAKLGYMRQLLGYVTQFLGYIEAWVRSQWLPSESQGASWLHFVSIWESFCVYFDDFEGNDGFVKTCVLPW